MLARLRALVARRRLPDEPPDDHHARELADLEVRLRRDKARTEALAKIRYTQWKLRKEQEKEYYLRYGVSVPATTNQREQDDFFEALETRMENERKRFLDQTKAIDSKDHEADRIERERQARERVLMVLENDLG